MNTDCPMCGGMMTAYFESFSSAYLECSACSWGKTVSEPDERETAKYTALVQLLREVKLEMNAERWAEMDDDEDGWSWIGNASRLTDDALTLNNLMVRVREILGEHT